MQRYCVSLQTASSLNPCFSGGWSQRTLRRIPYVNAGKVLILVLVEDGLRDLVNSSNRRRLKSLNPCFSGGWSQRPAYNEETHLVQES